MNENIIAITIGPIYDTMQLATNPAGLWATSYLFSQIASDLTRMISEKTNCQIITPWFDFKEDDKNLRSRGVGYYHDHILIRNASLAEVKTIIEEEKKVIGEKISDSLTEYTKEKVASYISEYLQIHAIEVEQKDGENAIQTTGSLLNAIELHRRFVTIEEVNYPAEFLDKESIKDSFLVDGTYSPVNKDTWMLTYSSNPAGLPSPEMK